MVGYNRIMDVLEIYEPLVAFRIYNSERQLRDELLSFLDKRLQAFLYGYNRITEVLKICELSLPFSFRIQNANW